ncbi:helix-turn-helix domain-containing protein [Rhizobium halophytocola]|uniref:Transcriptional regulator with XRE-family HTH domain n=1 Tax=Rhizobium halophytocola TaxID=735519 RepID=A0ABS4E6L1_9HYPH|nr:helix-turn-helix transcriptional regulator [Rhizobium halophytocola]MBP1853580.1 transcriptional regulator with XRE-family HTH domain [Rhizobium halophytocola]
MAKERTDIDIVVAYNLRNLRQLAGVTQKSLAEATGVTCQQIHKYESGESRIAAGKLPAVTRALGCTLAQVFQGLEISESELGQMSFAATKLAADFDNIDSVVEREKIAKIVASLAVDRAKPLPADNCANAGEWQLREAS